MKKLLGFLVIVLLISCEKPQTCWVCITQVIPPLAINPNIPDGYQRPTSQEYCDKTEAQIREIEKAGTFYHNISGFAWHYTTECKLK